MQKLQDRWKDLPKWDSTPLSTSFYLFLFRNENKMNLRGDFDCKAKLPSIIELRSHFEIIHNHLTIVFLSFWCWLASVYCSSRNCVGLISWQGWDIPTGVSRGVNERNGGCHIFHYKSRKNKKKEKKFISFFSPKSTEYH